MKFTRFNILLTIAVLLVTIGQSAYSRTTGEAAELWKSLTQQYRMVYNQLLIPAGKGDAFQSFQLQNPDFVNDSYKRSRTAAYIMDLLKEQPQLQDIFKECGLSQSGEFICHSSECPIHGVMFKTSTGKAQLSFTPQWVMKALIAAVAGVILFVAAVGLGRPICLWLDKKFPESEEDAE